MVWHSDEEHNETMNRNKMLGIVSGVVVVLSMVVLVIANVTNEPTVLDPASPEGVVQQYVSAVADEDWSAAHALFTPELADRCTVSEMSGRRTNNVSRVSIDDVSRADDTAIVNVTITHASLDDPLYTSTWDDRVTFVLVDSGGWAFDEVSWPYFDCGRFES